MKALMTAACLATAFALAADAQGQGQGQGQQQGQTQQTTPQQRSDLQQSVTLSGCLERDTAATGAAGQTGTPTSTQAFKLTDVTILSGAANIGRTGTGQQQQQREEDKDKTFRLQASAGVDLNQHVGHEVEVVGRLVSSDPSATAPRTGTATTGGTGTGTGTGAGQQQQQQQQQRTTPQREEDKDKAPLIMVSSIKMTATTCR